MTDRVGQQLGNYHLLRLLGQGMFASVYLGKHRYLERHAAIKVLHVRMEASSHEFFRREARTIAQLNHSHIIGVHDFGFEDDTPYLVMEYMEGGTLRGRFPKGTRLPFEQIIACVNQIAAALDYAHDLRVIHRDVKPENVLLDTNDKVVLSDFGIAVVQSTRSSLSMQNPAGTPIYMAPEQIQYQPGFASDQYALGVMVYEWLCGEPPFDGSLFEVFSQHLHKPPPSLCARLPALPPAIEDTVFGALDKDPERRFGSVTDFATALSEAFFATQPLSLRRGPQDQIIPLPTPSTDELGSSPGDRPNEATQPQFKAVQYPDHAPKPTVSAPPRSAMHQQPRTSQNPSTHPQIQVAAEHDYVLQHSDDPMSQSLEETAWLELDTASKPGLDEVARLLKHNLPLPLTSLVGREQDIARAKKLLRRSEVRLLTLTGMGGVGKTRLGIQIATDLLPTFADGVCFVSLASLAHANLVIPTIAQTLGLRETGGHTLFDLLARFLHSKQLLLLLDNFEQLLDAASSLVSLLQVCPGLKLLVTSRAALRVQGEQQFLVQPLGRSNSEDTNALTDRVLPPAIQLFTERVQALRPDFRLTSTNTSIVADICACVDGLPLAIELAASHIKLFPLPLLLKRLEQRLTILVNYTQDAPLRQQTLKKTLDWSYDLLDTRVARLFQHLSIFVGGCSLEAIETVEAACSDLPWPVLEGIALLIDNSLVQQINAESDEPHLLMLETVRAYGLERLQESGELERIRRAHAHYYLNWAEQAEAGLRSKEQVFWLERLEREHDNLRLALHWLGEHEKEGALRLICSLTWFWIMRGYLSEGRQWLEQALRYQGEQEISEQIIVKAFADLGEIAFYQNDFNKVMQIMTEASTLLENASDLRLLSFAAIGQAYMYRIQGEYTIARTTYEQMLELARQFNASPWDIAGLLWLLADIAFAQEEYQLASAAAQEGLTLMQEVEDSWSSVFHLNLLAYIAFAQNDLETAKGFAEEGLRLSTLLNNQCGTAYLHSLRVLGQIALRQGHDAEAGSLLEEALSIARMLEDQVSVASLLCDLGQVALNCRDEHKARVCYEESMALAHTLNDNKLLAEIAKGLATICPENPTPPG